MIGGGDGRDHEGADDRARGGEGGPRRGSDRAGLRLGGRANPLGNASGACRRWLDYRIGHRGSLRGSRSGRTVADPRRPGGPRRIRWRARLPPCEARPAAWQLPREPPPLRGGTTGRKRAMDAFTFALILLFILSCVVALPAWPALYRLLTTRKREAAARERLARLPPPEEALTGRGSRRGRRLPERAARRRRGGRRFCATRRVKTRYEEVVRIVERRRSGKAAATS